MLDFVMSASGADRGSTHSDFVVEPRARRYDPGRQSRISKGPAADPRRTQEQDRRPHPNRLQIRPFSFVPQAPSTHDEGPGVVVA